MEHNLIRDIALCIGAAWLLGVAAQLARQPVILAYLLGGFLLGPTTFKIVTDHSSIDTISELGLIFLLFMIGLEIDLKKIISAGKSITYTALSQIVGGAALGVLFFRLLGFGLGIKGVGGWDALYLGLGAALSSTVIIVKVLYDKRELDTLPGRITLGILVLQDLAAILFLAIQPNLNSLQAVTVLLSLLRVFVLVSSAMLVSKYLLPGIFHRVARLPELVLVGAIGWCFLVSQFAEMLDDIRAKYKEYGIQEEPFVIVKADAGTYGMGVMTVKDAAEVRGLNRKQRNKMAVGKEGMQVHEVLVQEGVYTRETVRDAVAEPVVYMIDRFVVGGFYRLNNQRGTDQNLNAPGMQFEPLAFAEPCSSPNPDDPDCAPNRFYAYGVIARLALLAASIELEKTQGAALVNANEAVEASAMNDVSPKEAGV